MSTLTDAERQTMLNLMANCQHYVEFGAGESTRLALRHSNILRIDSIESDGKFVQDVLLPETDVKKALAQRLLKFHIINIGPTKQWGYPRDKSCEHLWPNYALQVFHKTQHIDLVLVDGRFRIACALSTLLSTRENCHIMFHDFWWRPEYHMVLEFADTVSKIDSLAVLKRKPGIDKAKVKRLLKKYQYMPGDCDLSNRIKRKLRLTWHSLIDRKRGQIVSN